MMKEKNVLPHVEKRHLRLLQKQGQKRNSSDKKRDGKELKMLHAVEYGIRDIKSMVAVRIIALGRMQAIGVVWILGTTYVWTIASSVSNTKGAFEVNLKSEG